MFSKLLVFMGVAVVAVNAQTPPACVLACAQAAAGPDGCAYTDATCVCTSGQYQLDVGTCIQTYCTSADAAAASALQSALCVSASTTLTATSVPTTTNIISIPSSLADGANTINLGSTTIVVGTSFSGDLSTAASSSSSSAAASATTTSSSDNGSTTYTATIVAGSTEVSIAVGSVTIVGGSTAATINVGSTTIVATPTSTKSGAISTKVGVSAIVLSFVAGFLVL